MRQLPSIDQVLRKDSIRRLSECYSRQLVLLEVQTHLKQLRDLLLNGLLSKKELEQQLSQLDDSIASNVHNRLSPSLKKVVNATGVILHTNLGRAPISQTAVAFILEIATAYSNLEYSLEEGKRGQRDLHFETRIARFLDCQAATVCNNNAAAVFLILNSLAPGKKVLVSRGELIEIGGSFRIPAIMERSGALLKEVGSTNMTRISDYRGAIDKDTALILRVHPSNYRIVGFTHRPELSDLVGLSRETGIPLIKDAGSGYLALDSYPFLESEPTIQSVLAQGVDLVCFSGDKLLGGPQSGIVVGKKTLIDPIRKNPLMRACRVDKLTYAALEWTLTEYEKGTHRATIPIHQMLCITKEELKSRALRIGKQLNTKVFHVGLKEGHSLIGGGSAPGVQLPTWLLTVRSPRYSVGKLEEYLRKCSVPIVARIVENELLALDLRTVFADQEELIISAFDSISSRQLTS